MTREQQRQLKGVKERTVPSVNLPCHLHQGVRHPYSNALKLCAANTSQFDGPLSKSVNQAQVDDHQNLLARY